MKRRNMLGMIGAFAAGLLPFGAQAEGEPTRRRVRTGRVTPLGEGPALAGTLVLTRDATEVQVVDTTTETDVFSYTIPAGAFGTDRAVRLTLLGDCLNDKGSAGTVRIKVKLGSTTMWDETVPNLDDATPRAPWRMDLTVTQLAVNSQLLHGTVSFQLTSANAPTVGEGAFDAGNYVAICFGEAAEDEATDLTLAVTATMSHAHASFDCTKKFATLELL